MSEVTMSQVLKAPAAAVWRLLEDFGDINRWWPECGPNPIERVEVEGRGVGMIRHIYRSGLPTPVSERLDLIDPGTHTLMLSLVGTRPVGITAYVAEGQIRGIDAHTCRIDYRALVTTEPGREEQVQRALLKTWAAMFQGLEQAASQSC